MDMYISRVKLNPVRRGAVKLLSNPRAMHAAVEAAFPSPDHGRALWRTDRMPHCVDLLVVSRQQPDLRHLVEQGGWETSPPEVKPYGPHLDSLRSGELVHFRVKANPTRRVHDDEGRQRTYHHVTVQQQLGWFTTRAEGWGLLVGEAGVSVTERDRQVALRTGERAATHVSSVFSGVATIGDATALRAALVQGVGRGKAYGLGLLTVARL